MRSVDGGATFETPVLLQTSTPPTHPDAVAGPVPLVHPDGDVYVFWERTMFDPEPYHDLNNRFEYRKSTDGGATFGARVDIPHIFNSIGTGTTSGDVPRVPTNSLPMVAVDWSHCDTRGNIYVAFCDEGDDIENEQSDVYVMRLPEGVGSWDSPLMAVEGTPTEIDRHQVHPAIAVDDFGRVGVMWLDFREDDESEQYAVYFAYSLDGGVNWSDSIRVMDLGVVADTDPYNLGHLMIGDWIGLTAQHDTFYGVWTDLRNRGSDWTCDDGRCSGDVYMATVRLSVPDLDYDYDIDTTDFSIFGQCYGGAFNPPAPSCPPGVDADFDGDGDVDTGDFGIFGQFYSPGTEWCPSQGSGGGDGPSAGKSETEDAGYPTLEELYRWLEAYCKENGIPFP